MAGNRNNVAQPGSAFVVLIGLLAIIMLYVHITLRLTTHMHDIALLRAQSLQHMYLAEGLLLYGISWCKKNLHDKEPILKKQHTYEIYKGPWQLIKDTDWIGSILITYKKPFEYYIEATLYKGKQILHKQSCHLIYNDDNYRVSQWKIV
ncbi:MAG TPA: hypothetical protein VGW78_01915 [Candidatus Babeliales bacterium]|jgi:hypothetical protein|nr:hypothetical protein [Candidatus Babeliales bacterium]